MIEMPTAKPPVLAERAATKAIIEKLPSLMEAKGMSVTDLVRETGINKSTIYALLDRDEPYESELGGDKMASIAVVFGMTLTELTGI